jgi:hypothetical protein
MSFKIDLKRVDRGRMLINVKPDVEGTREAALRRGYTEVQAEILAQLTALNPLWIHAYDIKKVLNIADGYGVRLHHRSCRGIINIDIIYEPGPDAYRIEAYRIVGLNAKQIARYEGVYFMELEDVISKILNGDVFKGDQ